MILTVCMVWNITSEKKKKKITDHHTSFCYYLPALMRYVFFKAF